MGEGLQRAFAAARDTSFAWINRNYGLSIKRGTRVVYTGAQDKQPRTGTVTSAKGQYVKIKLDGEKRASAYHPTWELRYLDTPANG